MVLVKTGGFHDARRFRRAFAMEAQPKLAKVGQPPRVNVAVDRKQNIEAAGHEDLLHLRNARQVIQVMFVLVSRKLIFEVQL